MSRLNIRQSSKVPDARRYVAVCMTCRHWQCDIRPGAVSDFGGARPAFMVLAEAHVEHLADCPGAGGRVNYEGQWVDPPKMSDGADASGALEMQPLPPWWVAR